jgi:hypothetical protein
MSTENANAQTTSSAVANTETLITATSANTQNVQAEVKAETKVEENVKQTEAKEAPKTEGAKEPTYDLKLSENSLLDQKRLEDVVAYAKANKLTPEQAQGLLSREEALVKSAVDEHNNAIAKQTEEWKQASLADKEIGGPEFNKNVEMAHRVLKDFGNDTINKFLEESGFGNHPDVLRMFVRLGKATAEDRIINPNVNGGNKKSLEDIFYGKTN